MKFSTRDVVMARLLTDGPGRLAHLVIHTVRRQPFAAGHGWPPPAENTGPGAPVEKLVRSRGQLDGIRPGATRRAKAHPNVGAGGRADPRGRPVERRRAVPGLRPAADRRR